MMQAYPQMPLLPAGSRLGGQTAQPTGSRDLGIYAQCVGELMYLAVTVRPDLAYIAGVLGRFMHAPTVELMNLLRTLRRYLKRTAERKFTFWCPSRQGFTKIQGGGVLRCPPWWVHRYAALHFWICFYALQHRCALGKSQAGGSDSVYYSRRVHRSMCCRSGRDVVVEAANGSRCCGSSDSSGSLFPVSPEEH